MILNVNPPNTFFSFDTVAHMIFSDNFHAFAIFNFTLFNTLLPITAPLCNYDYMTISSGDWKDIFIAHVIIIIKSEVSTFPLVIIFFRGRVSEMFVTSYYVTYCMYIPGKLGFCYHHYFAVIHFQYMGLYVFSWDDMLLCLIIIIKSEVWTIIHCLGLGHETMVCAVCLFIFLQGKYADMSKLLIVYRLVKHSTLSV